MRTPTSDPQLPVPRSIYSHQVNVLGAVTVDDLQLLPRDRSGLSLQKIQTWDVEAQIADYAGVR